MLTKLWQFKSEIHFQQIFGVGGLLFEITLHGVHNVTVFTYGYFYSRNLHFRFRQQLLCNSNIKMFQINKNYKILFLFFFVFCFCHHVTFCFWAVLLFLSNEIILFILWRPLNMILGDLLHTLILFSTRKLPRKNPTYFCLFFYGESVELFTTRT